jgi:hypothetical protein
MLTRKERKATALLERFIPDGLSNAASHRNEEAALQSGTASLNETMPWLDQTIASRS